VNERHVTEVVVVVELDSTNSYIISFPVVRLICADNLLLLHQHPTDPSQLSNMSSSAKEICLARIFGLEDVFELTIELGVRHSEDIPQAFRINDARVRNRQQCSLRLLRNLTTGDPEFDGVPVPELLRRAEGLLNIILNNAINGEEADIQQYRQFLQDLRNGDATIMTNELRMNFRTLVQENNNGDNRRAGENMDGRVAENGPNAVVGVDFPRVADGNNEVAREGGVEDVNEGRPMADIHMREIDLLIHPNRPRLRAFENRNEDEVIEFGGVLNEPVEEKEDSDSQ